MKTSIKSLLAVLCAGFLTVAAQAQPAIKVAVIDLAKIYDGHYKTEEQNAKLKSDQQKAEDDLQKLNAEGNVLVKDFNDMKEQLNNPALSAEGKIKTQKDLEEKGQEIQRKQGEVNSFRTNVQRSLQQRINSFKQFLLEEINKTAIEIAKKKGATLLLDKSGPSLIGVPSLIYFDPAYDITEEVSKEVNKDRPAASAAAPAPAVPAAPAAAPAAAKPAAAKPAAEAPAVSFPSTKK